MSLYTPHSYRLRPGCYIYIYILVWTRACPCTKKSEAESRATEYSVTEHRFFKQLLRTLFWAFAAECSSCAVAEEYNAESSCAVEYSVCAAEYSACGAEYSACAAEYSACAANTAPVEQNAVPVQQNTMPAQQNAASAQQNTVPAQQNTVCAPSAAKSARHAWSGWNTEC